VRFHAAVRIDFEILCQDDASNSSLNALNEHVNELSNCSFVSLKENLAHQKPKFLAAQSKI
jgi:hypothetical protein